jgi:hypothetical protein
MRHKATTALTFILVLLGAVLVGQARADQWNKKTILVFSHPIEVPGNMVLPAGKYVFKLHDSMSYRHIVQIWNEDETKLLTTILAIPNYRLEPTGETFIEFHERPGIQPQALRAWFYPGDQFGQEFAYPKPRAVQLAEASNEVVPAEVATTEPSPEELKSVPLVAVTPKHEEEPIAKAIEVTPPTAQPGPMSAEEKELPKGASPVPLAGLVGLIAVALGFGVRMFVRRTS